ncbi:MAG: cysteine peptidase family C39 domain-containing protein, partial [Mucilaginibacter sp.]|uniref:cysteine peptidase family C39 domain-containing protein n=1 Tax=Mucilaginibacter sp. TaxID=1882438 RepID=UPI0035692112
MIAFYKIQNAEAAVFKLLKKLSINVDHVLVSAELEKHPDYPSLLAISDVLSNFNIENSAFRVEYDQLAIVPCPFIAHTNINNGDFVVVDKMDSKNITVSSDKWNWHKLPLAEFETIFNGVVLTAETRAFARPGNTFNSTFARFKNPAVGIGAALVFLAALVFHSNYITGISWQSLLLALFKTAGLITSVLLLIQFIDSNNPLVQVLCQTGGKTNCNAILSSKAAKVFEGLTWSEVGFFYFAGTWLLLLFGGGSATVWQVLVLLNFVSLPYTLYSIYYQA